MVTPAGIYGQNGRDSECVCVGLLIGGGSAGTVPAVPAPAAPAAPAPPAKAGAAPAFKVQWPYSCIFDVPSV